MDPFVITAIVVSMGLLVFTASTSDAAERVTDHVNPFLGTATLWDEKDLGFKPTHRTWGAEVFPGSSVPNAMVQLSPVTQFRSGSGYQYEDTSIQAFTHTSKGHWNLCNVPLLPVTGTVTPTDFSSPYSHKKESARPGFYQVFLERYGINVELSSTLRCGFHRYTYPSERGKKLIVDLSVSNEKVRGHALEQVNETTFEGYQQTREKIYFHAVANRKISDIETFKKGEDYLSVLHFEDTGSTLELRIGFSYVSTANAKANLEKEMLGKSFSQVREEATTAWEALLSRIQVYGGTERQRNLFYSTLYRSFLWPALRSDANGDFVDRSGKVVNKGFQYYTDPSFWDDYRNKLVLLGMMSPEVTVDVIKSLIDKGEHTGFIPTFFHGDHAAAYIAGMYLRGIRGFDAEKALKLLIRNATIEGGTRPHITAYMEKGYVPEQDLEHPVLETVANAGVTKTLEYAYDDYAVALLARALGDTNTHEQMMKRTGNYRNVFDPSTGFMRGRLADGTWIQKFDPETPYYEYMYREANAWQSTFFAPHDPRGLIALYPSPEAFEKKLDDLFSIPWKGVEADNLSVFIGQYCHGNQPDHGFPYMYYFVGKQEKAQAIIDHILENFYDMGRDKLAYAGMDDAGEMSSWYVLNALGMYTFSPADPEYIVTVPLFDKVEFRLGNGAAFSIVKEGQGRKIKKITCGGEKIDGYVVRHQDLAAGKDIVITTE